MNKENPSQIQTPNETPSDKKPSGKKRKKSEKSYVWPLTVTLISLVLCCVLSFGAELLLSDAAVAVAVVLIVALVAVSILADMMGLAVASCDPVPLNSMASRKIRGARHALRLCRNADKVSSVLNDVVGDSIGIITGVCGAALAMVLAGELQAMARIAVAVAVSAVIAALTIGGKAVMKRVAIKHSIQIVLYMGKFMALFGKEVRK